jgi:hypothetical protein
MNKLINLLKYVKIVLSKNHQYINVINNNYENIIHLYIHKICIYIYIYIYNLILLRY